jgi:5-methylthioribose kinase
MRFELSTETTPIQDFLDQQGWTHSGETVETAERAGEGNMNRTIRVRTNLRSVILKQSYPYCAKFPDIPAPIDRIAFEVKFYDIARRSEGLAARMPRVLAFAHGHHLAMLEDLGSGSDLLSLYAGDRLAQEELVLLGDLARALHQLPISADERRALRNEDMRVLNHEHIFDIPLRPKNGLDLDGVTEGLAALAADLQRDDRYREGINALGKLYLDSEGPALLHGDYYPGSFLRTERGLAIIDPEFGFCGPPEFDLSVLVAHLIFSGEDGPDVLERVLTAYSATLDRSLVKGFAGAELMRRTLGVSQLPLDVSLATKLKWLEISRAWVGEV